MMEIETELLTHRVTPVSESAELVIDASHAANYEVSPRLYGEFSEHLGHNIYHGIEAQILANSTFGKWRFSAGDDHPDGGVREETDSDRIRELIEEETSDAGWHDPQPVIEAYMDGCAYSWFRVGAKEQVRFSPDVGPYGERAQRIEVIGIEGRPSRFCGIATWSYLPLHRTRWFEYRLVGRAATRTEVLLLVEPYSLRREVLRKESKDSSVAVPLRLQSNWETLEGMFELPDSAPLDTLYRISVTSSGPMNIVLDRLLIYPSDHMHGADPEVIAFLRDANLPLARWPGGNFASGYHWRDGVGPVDARPTVPNPAWSGLEFNLFGTDEFIQFCREVKCEPLICINAGDGTPQEAADWVEYCNGSTETRMGRLRAEHGHPEAYGVQYWEIGNELYGRWQVGRTTADGNLDRYRRFRDEMLRRDPALNVLGCGQGNEPNSDWNKRLIFGAGGALQCITDHILTGGTVNENTDLQELFHAFMGYAGVLEDRYRLLRQEMHRNGIKKPKLAITELMLFARPHADRGIQHSGFISSDHIPSPDTIAEALYHATITNSCIRLGQFVELLTHSTTVNVGGGLQKERERVYATPVYYGQSITRSLAGGFPLPIELSCGTYSTDREFGEIPPLRDVPLIDAMAVKKGDDELVLLLVHRAAHVGTIKVGVRIDGFMAHSEGEVVSLAGDTWHARNTLSIPDRIVPKRSSIEIVDGRCFLLGLSPFSLVRVSLKKNG